MIRATSIDVSITESRTAGAVKVFVAIADVNAVFKNHSALDEHAQTARYPSVYTAAEIFPMLPEKLSTDITSLNFESDRFAVVVEMVVGEDGSLQSSDIYRAAVRNRAKLAYDSVADGLRGAVRGGKKLVWSPASMQTLGFRIALPEKMKALRYVHGALNFETIEARPVFDNDEITRLDVERKKQAKDIIEDFMIAANSIASRYLALKKYPSLRRIVRTPKIGIGSFSSHWSGVSRCRKSPTQSHWNSFSDSEQAADPLRFPGHLSQRHQIDGSW